MAKIKLTDEQTARFHDLRDVNCDEPDFGGMFKRMAKAKTLDDLREIVGEALEFAEQLQSDLECLRDDCDNLECDIEDNCIDNDDIDDAEDE